MKAYIIVIIATLLWGVWGFAEKQAVTRAHPYTIQWMYSLPYIALIPFWYWLGGQVAPVTNHDPRAFLWAIFASISSTIALMLIFFALRLQPASWVFAATSTYPLVTLLISVATGNETLSMPRLVGILLIVIGVIFMQYTDTATEKEQVPLSSTCPSVTSALASTSPVRDVLRDVERSERAAPLPTS